MSELQSLLLSLLEEEVKPSSGCTEIASIGLSVAAATKSLDKDKVKVDIYLDFDTFKNAAAVGVPGGGFGIKDCVRKALYGNPEQGLKVLTSTEKIYDGEIKLQVNPLDVSHLFVYTVIDGKNSSLISHRHDNIVYKGAPLRLKEAVQKAVKAKKKDSLAKLYDKKKHEVKVPYDKIVENLKSLAEIPSVKSKVEEGIYLNSRLAEENLESEKYLGIARSLPSSNLTERMIKYTVAAVESRMGGSSIPAMAVAGSGNQGIAATLPIVVYSREKGIGEEKEKEAILLSWLTTIYTTAFTKYISPICGQGIKAGVGLASGLGYLLDENYKVVEGAIANHLASLTGMICDGAKSGCSLKVASAVDTAYRAAILSASGIKIDGNEGIVSNTVEETLRYLGEYVDAAEYLNEKIVEIMRRKLK